MTAPPVTLRSPAQLLAVIPHLLGFEPRNAIVVVALKDNKISLTQRMDLPHPERVEETADTLVRHVLDDAAEGALLVGYEHTLGGSSAVIDALSDRLEARDVSVRDRLIVHDGRWRSLDCDRPGCCPPGGSPLPPPAEIASAVAEFIGLGSAPLPDRQALAEQLEPGRHAAEVADLLRQRKGAPTTPTESDTKTDTDVRQRLADAWARVLSSHGSRITVADAAVALQSLTDVSLRDGLAAVLIPNGLDLDVLPQNTQSLVGSINALRAAGDEDETAATTGAMKSRLIDLCQLAPNEHAAPALTLLATYSWWHGDGALARVAIDRALRCDRGYRLAQLLRLMLDEGIRPERP